MTLAIRDAGKALLQRCYSPRRFLWRLPAGHGAMALTFDDGPDPLHTPALLDLLAAHGVKASFFVIGDKVSGQAALMRRIAAEGHAIGGHTWSHRDIVGRSRPELGADLQRCRLAIGAACGVDTALFRPPRGRVDLAAIHHVAMLGYCMVHWSKTYGDYRRDGAERLLARVRATPPGAGDIALFHDHNEHTLAVLRALIPEWLAGGLGFAAIPGGAAAPR
ncbi:peptidoglycan-N-acetylglucosamine deacetylase [Janthinobacterium sp. CG_23.3]|uniref:polysaccharide deacetylase family protein n=1 Tax=unclassified Janthinobacterium TaxID=2610881 RepID=UPI000344DC7F|nr:MULTISPECIES: polysaccharide deacetylase family protein [unclassified Janthinobacterium]MEC5161192.1 peptidoglycan/xylan/chitin deacetylase (PgdA/CDA1 family) [Janthinobacterium sp. CG_S6]